MTYVFSRFVNIHQAAGLGPSLRVTAASSKPPYPFTRMRP